MSKTYSAGIVTAYGAAKRAGYQGTYEDFCRQQAGYAESAATVEQAKNTAVSAASTATTKAGEAATAATAAQTAKTQTEQAASQALTDIGTARTAAISALQTEGQTQTANARAQAQAAAQSATTASTKASEASASATSAGRSATNAAASATSAAQSASDAQDVLDSIPADYSDLSNDVGQLKADLRDLDNDYNDLKSAINTISAYGDNLLDLSTVTDDVRLASNGTTQTENGYYTTDFIPVIEGMTYSKNSPVLNIYHRICLYTESKAFISADNTSNTVTVPNGCKYIRFSGKAEEKATAYFCLHTAYDYELRHNLPFVIPQQYGAVGDGVTDDTTALQIAINSGKKVVLPKGVYLITSPLIISADAVRIEGAVNNHWNNTTGVCAVIKAGASVQSMLMIKDGICCLELKNVNLDGNSLAEYGIYHESGTAYTHDHTIKNVRVSNCLTCGISLERGYKSVFENVRTFNTNIGFSLKGYVSGQTYVFGTTMSLINCYSDACGTGFELAYLSYSSLINCASDHSAFFCYRIIACFNVGLMNCGCEGTKRVPIALFGDCRSIKIGGFSVLALDENLESNRSCIIHCANAVMNMIVDGIYISPTEYPRDYIINNTVTEGTSITVLDDSVKPEDCLSTADNCIAFVFNF